MRTVPAYASDEIVVVVVVSSRATHEQREADPGTYVYLGDGNVAKPTLKTI